MEVGKKYIGPSTGRVFPCVGIASDGRFLLEDTTEGYFFPINDSSKFKEHIEPKAGTFWINIYPHGAGGDFKTRAAADEHQGPKRLACIEVKWTEGEGL